MGHQLAGGTEILERESLADEKTDMRAPGAFRGDCEQPGQGGHG